MEVIRTAYDEKNKIFRIEIKGNIDYNKIQTAHEALFKCNKIPKACKKFLFIDAGIDSIKNTTDYETLRDFYLKFPEYFNGGKVAVCVFTPQMHALVFNIRSRFETPVLRPFATEKNAYQWLNQPI
ncbi:MAG: hypothetical protein ACK5MI_01450 [Mangrovibacterium sp.]